jgi:hypothetical protein
MVDRVVALVDTWPAWDGQRRPRRRPRLHRHKAVRRVTDHMIDHLAEVEARLAQVWQLRLAILDDARLEA